MDEDMPKDNSSSAGALMSSGIMGSFPLLGAIDVQHDHHLVHPFQVRLLSLSGLATSHSALQAFSATLQVLHLSRLLLLFLLHLLTPMEKLIFW